MKYVEIPPPSNLQSCAEVLLRFSFASSGEKDYRIPPTGSVSLVYHAQRSESGGLIEGGKLSFFGPADRPTVARQVDGLEVVGVRLSIGSLKALFGLPPSTIRGLEIDVEECCPQLAAAADKMRATSTRAEVFTAMTRMLVKRMRQSPPSQDASRRRTRVTEALRRLRMGNRKIASLAGSLGVSERTLHRDVVAEVGLPPKTLARLYRFESARTLLRGGTVDLSEIALACGYADQSHMAVEVLELAGEQPSVLRKSAVMSEFQKTVESTMFHTPFEEQGT